MKHLALLALLAVLAIWCSFLSAQEAEVSGHAPDADSFDRIINITILPGLRFS